MASAELQTLINMLRTNSPLSGTTVAEKRASMEAATGMMPLPSDVAYEPVSADGVPAEWATADASNRDRVMIYFHGGGYVTGSVRTHRILAGDISRATGAAVLSVDYRLAPEHPYPAAVEDAVAAYRYVCRHGIAASKIVLAGDSAGGGLTVAAMLALRDAGDQMPAAGVCISPWVDLSLSGDSMTSKAAEDPMVDREGLHTMAEAYLAGADPRTPNASPLFADLAGLPPLLVHVGTAETLLDDSTRFAERARAAGVDVVLDIWPDMIHVWHAFAMLLPEGRQAIDRIGTYVRERVA